MDGRHLHGPLPGREPDRMPRLRPRRPAPPLRALVARGPPERHGRMLRRRDHDAARAGRLPAHGRAVRARGRVLGGQRLHHAARARAHVLGQRRGRRRRIRGAQLDRHPRRAGGGGGLPLPGRHPRARPQRRPARGADRAHRRPAARHRRRRRGVVPRARPAGDRGHGLRREIARGRALGLPPRRGLRGRRAPGRQPRRRRRHHGRGLRQIAGAFHGARGIPERWRAVLAMRDRIEGFADRLLELRPPPPASA